MGFAVSALSDAVHLCRTVGRNLLWDNLFDGHAVGVAQHKLDVGEGGHLVGIRQTVKQLVGQLAQQD